MRGPQAAVLLLHGLTETWRVWQPHIEALSDNHQLILPDLRGHGDTRNPGSTLTPIQVAREMLALLDSLRISQVQPAGYSFGGHVALRMAALQTKRLEAMIVIAGAHRLIGKSKAFHDENARTDLPSDWYLDLASTRHPGGEEQVQRAWCQGIAAALEADFALSDSSLAAVQTRALIVQGDSDEIFPLDVALELHGKIRRSQLWIIPETGHATVFYQGVAPSNVDFGGSIHASGIFAEVVEAFLARGTL